MANRPPTSVGAALGIAAACASNFRRRIFGASGESDRLWKGAALCVLIVVLATRLAAAAVASLFRDRGTIGFTGIAAAIVFATFAHLSHHGVQTGMGEFGPRATPAPVRGPEIAPAAERKKQSPNNVVSFNVWKAGVEQALEAAKVKDSARQQDGAKPDSAGEAAQPSGLPQEKATAPIDLGVAREVANVRPNGLIRNESASASETKQASATEAASDAKPTEEPKEPESLSQSPAADASGTVSTYGGPVPREGREERPWPRRIAHVWGRGRWRGRHYGWTYFRLTGVGRAFPFVLSAR
jgi:hypothetical protein